MIDLFAETQYRYNDAETAQRYIQARGIGALAGAAVVSTWYLSVLAQCYASEATVVAVDLLAGESLGGASLASVPVVGVVSLSKLQLGRTGEAAAGIVSNTERIGSASGTATYRVPDYLNHAARIIGEVKNVRSLSYTGQLRDYASYALSKGYSFHLWTRPTTQLSGPLNQAVKKGVIVLRYLP